ncbi:hypothetical protein CVT25_011433 [Psilocybe cyanescens]|uniref:WD-like domain-containing protein n=1 Tax=Psilocybe cyanescens TaxID=93625 RepID=A0A409XV57_PSICY|nr:hypothetical protein CVT25_011433 [Psilocybe cyanescens]
MAVMIPAVMSVPQSNAEVISVSRNHSLVTNVLQARVDCPGNTNPNEIYCDYVNNRGSSVACDKIIHKLSNLTPDTKYTGAECDWDSYDNRCCISWNTIATKNAGIRGQELGRAAQRIREKCGAGGASTSGSHRSAWIGGWQFCTTLCLSNKPEGCY